MLRIALVAGVLACVGLADGALAERRVALVIGNSAYQTVPSLTNPKNDATDMAVKLRTLGFEVVDGTDLDLKSMSGKVRDFTRLLDGAEVGLFFYAGHGLQVNGTNYLAPVDAKLETEADLDFEMVPIDIVIKQLERSAKLSLVFLDACRNSPFSSKLAASSRGQNASRGLARIETASGILISFATQPGNVALDGKGRNSPFTGALLRNIDTPGRGINEMLISVRRDVMSETDGKQVPWENSSLTGVFSFTPAAAEVQTAAVSTATEPVQSVPQSQMVTIADAALDHTFWTSIQNSSDPALFRAYLDKFPNGVFSALAKLKLDDAEEKRSIGVEASTSPAAGESADKTAAPAETAAPTKVASASETAATVEEAAPDDKGRFADLEADELALLQQKELSRVGCYDGTVDGNWGAGTSAAMESFSKAVNLELATDAPNADALIALESQHDLVCAAEAEGDGDSAPRKSVKQRERAKTKKAVVEPDEPKRTKKRAVVEPEEPRQKKKVTRTDTPKRVIKVEITPRKKKKIVGDSDSSGGSKGKLTIGIGSGGGVGIGVGF